ncbi:uncharacterized protein LOC131955454 [Physella acuta]|uniref:uncharacterized protein LOC131955454 n=1 Tax=Physella acuta TaxID=109671 RepID=UPI0027DC4448|nr:uncharacterized protein LOC131955454 [Physella acuta]
MEDSPHQHDIPIWFNGTQRWMTGLTKRTTCDDIIYAILYSTGLHESESTDNFAIFEKWREVERPLSARTKILKIWATWGQDQASVQLSMRSLDDYFLPGESSLYLRSRRRHRKTSRHKGRHGTSCRCHNKRGCDECSRLKPLEQLVKLVVSHERKIQSINDRIYETDRLIDRHESKIHNHRVQQNGMDYVQNSYLNSHSSESSSSLDCFSSLDLRDLSQIFPESSQHELEEISRLSDDLAHVERRLAEEMAKIQEIQPEVERLSGQLGLESAMEGETDAELEDTRTEMIRAVTLHVTNEYNERELDRKMDVCLHQLEQKAIFESSLVQELSQLQERLGVKDMTFTEVNWPSNQERTSSDHPRRPSHVLEHSPPQHQTRTFASAGPGSSEHSNLPEYSPPDPCGLDTSDGDYVNLRVLGTESPASAGHVAGRPAGGFPQKKTVTFSDTISERFHPPSIDSGQSDAPVFDPSRPVFDPSRPARTSSSETAPGDTSRRQQLKEDVGRDARPPVRRARDGKPPPIKARSRSADRPYAPPRDPGLQHTEGVNNRVPSLAPHSVHVVNQYGLETSHPTRGRYSTTHEHNTGYLSETDPIKVASFTTNTNISNTLQSHPPQIFRRPQLLTTSQKTAQTPYSNTQNGADFGQPRPTTSQSGEKQLTPVPRNNSANSVTGQTQRPTGTGDNPRVRTLVNTEPADHSDQSLALHGRPSNGQPCLDGHVFTRGISEQQRLRSNTQDNVQQVTSNGPIGRRLTTDERTRLYTNRDQLCVHTPAAVQKQESGPQSPVDSPGHQNKSFLSTRDNTHRGRDSHLNPHPHSSRPLKSESQFSGHGFINSSQSDERDLHNVNHNSRYVTPSAGRETQGKQLTTLFNGRRESMGANLSDASKSLVTDRTWSEDDDVFIIEPANHKPLATQNGIHLQSSRSVKSSHDVINQSSGHVHAKDLNGAQVGADISERGALYHILSNKMNKSGSPSPKTQSSPVGLSTQLGQVPLGNHPNLSQNSVWEQPSEDTRPQRAGDKHGTNNGSALVKNGYSAQNGFTNSTSTLPSGRQPPHPHHGPHNGGYRFDQAKFQLDSRNGLTMFIDSQTSNEQALNFSRKPNGISSNGGVISHQNTYPTTEKHVDNQYPSNHNSYYYAKTQASESQHNQTRWFNTVNLKEIPVLNNRDQLKHVHASLMPTHIGGHGKTKVEDSNDSDTGLSSMHSDEATNMETLV